MNTANIENSLRALTERLGYEFVGLESARRGGRDVLSLYADREGGFSLDDCERLSKEAGALLDEMDAGDGAYLLEVGSPGLERPLFKPDDYRRFAGREANVRLSAAAGGRKRFRGVIEAATDDAVRFRAEGAEFEVPLSGIVSARLVYIEEKGRKKSFKKSGGKK